MAPGLRSSKKNSGNSRVIDNDIPAADTLRNTIFRKKLNLQAQSKSVTEIIKVSLKCNQISRMNKIDLIQGRSLGGMNFKTKDFQ